MSVPDEIKWTTHRPVILAAPDWPEMVELKAHAASLGADVEVTSLVQPMHAHIVWVEKGFVGSAATRLEHQYAEVLAGGFNEVAHHMQWMNKAAREAAAALRKFAELAPEDGR